MVTLTGKGANLLIDPGEEAFGTKKGKVYLENGSTKPKSCKVLEWNGVRADGDRTIRVAVPKLPVGPYHLRVTNGVGSGIKEKGFTVE